MNQAFFARVLMTEVGVVGWEYNQPFALLMGLREVAKEVAADNRRRWDTPRTNGRSIRGYQRRSPSLLARAFAVPGLKASNLAEGVGFEPTEGCPSHAFQACRFGRSRTPPRVPPG